MSSLSPSTIASAAVAVARAAREYLETLSDEQAESVTETKVREHASRAALESSPRFAGIAVGSEVVKAAVAEEVRAFLDRRVAAAAGVKKEEEEENAPPPTLAARPARAGRGGGGAGGGGAGGGGARAKEGEGEGRRVARGRAPRKASTASFIVSDDAAEDEDGDYEEGDDDEDEDDDDDSEEEEGESSDDDESKAEAAPPPKKKTKRGGGAGRPAATAATSVGESPAVFKDENNDGAGGRAPVSAAAKALHAAAAAAARPSASIPAVLRLPLGDRRFASVSRLGGTRRLDVREWYLPKGESESEGGLKPGLKGISLGAAAVKTLRSRAVALDEALKGGRDFSFALEEKAAGGSADNKEGGGGGGGGGGSQGGGGGGGWQQQRAPTRKVAATSLWQNVWRVDLREHFLSGNEWRPTKKGISLSPAAWDKLVESLPELESAVVGAGPD